MLKRLAPSCIKVPAPVLTHDELLQQANKETVYYINYMREQNIKDRLELTTKLAVPNADFTRIISWNLSDMVTLEINEGVVKYFDQLVMPEHEGEVSTISQWEAIKIIHKAVQKTLLDNYSWRGEDLEPNSTSIAHNACASLRQAALKNFYRNGFSFVRYNAKQLGEVL
jgi:hypothetical protein